MPTSRNGQIVTFYSYKGGTGRSMMLANVAWVIASNGKRVLAVDWDLEAPGLHRYFYPFLVDKELTTSDGLIDVVIEYGVEAVSPTAEGDRVPDDDWYIPFADVLRYAAALNYPFRGAGTLDFLSAGRQSESYAARVNTFDWQRFYDRLGGWRFIEALKTSMRDAYDFILVDSRTGVSDTSGICTVQMPDTLVACFTLNHQGIDGAAAIVRSVLQTRAANAPRVLPVPMRTDPFEQKKLEARMKYARSKFAGLPADLDDERRNEYWLDADVPYIPFYGYEELLATFGDEIAKRQSLLASVETLATRLAGEAMRSIAPDARRRESVLLAYQRRSTDDTPDDSLDREAERLFTGLSPTEQSDAEHWVPRLVRLAEVGGAAADTATRVPLEMLGDYRSAVQAFAVADLVRVEPDASLGKDTIQFTNPATVNRWQRLRGWLERDREFLLWRQQLGALIATYRANANDPTVLLAGAPLETAVKWRDRRRADLNESERKFIDESFAAQRAAQARVVQAKETTDDLLKRLEHERQDQIRRLAEMSRAQAAQSAKQYSVDARKASRKAIAIGVTSFVVLATIVAYLVSQRVWFDSTQKQISLAAYVALAQAGLSQDSTAKALAYADSAIALDANASEAYFVRGVVYRMQLNPTSAFTNLSRAIALEPRFTAAYSERAALRLDSGDSSLALSDLDRAVTLDSTEWRAIFERARLRDALGDIRSALGDYDRAISLRPDSAEPYYYRGVAREALGETKNAASDYQQVVKLVGRTSQLGQAADARWKRIAPTRPLDTTAVVRVVSVSLQYSAPQDSAIVAAVANSLRKSKYRTTTLRSPRTSMSVAEVRYYSASDARTATQVQRAVESVLAQQGILVKFNIVADTASRSIGRPIRTMSTVDVLLPVLSRYPTQARE